MTQLTQRLGLVFFAVCAVAACRGACSRSTPAADAAADAGAALAADVIYYNGTVVTMDSTGSTGQWVATRAETIAGVGTGSSWGGLQGRFTQMVNLDGGTIAPGFIDSHSHMSAWGFYNDPANWLDVSSVNVLLKPSPGSPGCPDAGDYQRCFIPVQTQDDVIARLKAAVAAAPSKTSTILAFNYDPSRLGHSAGCPDAGLGFACPNFENGTARKTLDAISKTNPIMVTSESGHINYVNTPMLTQLNICQQLPGDGGCVLPIQNAATELQLAQLGQLDEDLALYASGFAVGSLVKQDAGYLTSSIFSAAATYAQNGFTLIQEGASTEGLAGAYLLATAEPTFPVSAAMLIYDGTSLDVSGAVKQAATLKKLGAINPKFIVAGVKGFSDGSTQGYTGLMSQPYSQVFYPFTSTKIFPQQPYVGLPDLSSPDLATAYRTAHNGGFPLMIHQNGDTAIANVVAALADAGTSPGLRDLMVHFSLPDGEDIQNVKQLGAGVTFLMPNVYFYGLPMCQQVLGPERTAQLYPAADTADAGIRFGLHADTPVMPPSPLFMIWTAKTRQTQQPSWYPNQDATNCPVVMGGDQAISILQGLKAFTIDAAYLYGLDGQYGSIEPGKIANLVLLSDNPLSMEDQPDQLMDIRILGTVLRGKLFPNPSGAQPPVWPG